MVDRAVYLPNYRFRSALGTVVYLPSYQFRSALGTVVLAVYLPSYLCYWSRSTLGTVALVVYLPGHLSRPIDLNW